MQETKTAATPTKSQSYFIGEKEFFTVRGIGAELVERYEKLITAAVAATPTELRVADKKFNVTHVSLSISFRHTVDGEDTDTRMAVAKDTGADKWRMSASAFRPVAMKYERSEETHHSADEAARALLDFIKSADKFNWCYISGLDACVYFESTGHPIPSKSSAALDWGSAEYKTEWRCRTWSVRSYPPEAISICEAMIV